MVYKTTGDTVTQLEEEALIGGDTFVASVDGDLGSAGTLNLYLDNPSDSGVEALFYSGLVTHEGEIELTFYDTVSSVSGGSAATLNNNRIGGRASELTATQDVTYTGDNEHHTVVYTGSDTEDLFDGYRMLLPSGEDVVIEITDQSGGNDETAIRVAFVELKE